MRDLAALAGLSLVILTINFNARQLVTNDDARFPVLARDILAHGNWLLPALPDGLPHLAKPPLAAWLISLVAWPGGAVTVPRALLPSLLEAVGVIMVTYWTGRRLFEPTVGIVAALITVTTAGVFVFAHSAMPDMALLLTVTAALAVYAACEFGGSAGRLTGFYALVGVGCLVKGAAGLMPLGIALAYTLVVDRARAWSLISTRRFLVAVVIAIPWWIVAAAAGRARFVQDIVLLDEVFWYVPIPSWHWRPLVAPLGHAVAVTLPWSVLVPCAIWAAIRQRDPATARRLRLLLVWVAIVFGVVALSYQQRERYYLPLCPAVGLLLGWWYSTLTWRRRRLAFAVAWIAIVAVGTWIDTVQTQRLSAVTDLAAIQAALRGRSGPVYATDVPELALTFNLARPVVTSESFAFFRDHLPQDGQLIISHRALHTEADTACLRHVASGMLARQPLALVTASGCLATP